MILRGSYKPEAFIAGIAHTIAGRTLPEQPDAEAKLTRDYIAAHGDVIYLAGGYWRAVPVWRGDNLLGVRLINPDRTPAEIRAAEAGIAVLRHLGYVAD